MKKTALKMILEAAKKQVMSLYDDTVGGDRYTIYVRETKK